MAERPSKPPFSEKGTDNEDQLARILNKKPALVGETYLPRTGKALEYAKLLLAEDATPEQKQQLKKAWEWRDGEYAEWRRKCDKAAVEAQRAALEERPEKRQRRQPKLIRGAAPLLNVQARYDLGPSAQEGREGRRRVSCGQDGERWDDCWL